MPYIEYYGCTKKPSCPSVPTGKFSYVVYSTVDELQRHIITYGAVVTAFIVYAVSAAACRVVATRQGWLASWSGHRCRGQSDVCLSSH
jgi:hypothetical protein